MLTKDEATRIAGAVNAARPDWSVPSLMAVLADDRCRNRAYRDLFLAFVALALDPESRKPTRIYGDGPWWEITAPNPHELSASRFVLPPAPDDCDVCGLPPPAPHTDHEYAPRDSSGYGQNLPPDLRETLSEEMTRIDRELTAAPCGVCGQPPIRHTAPAYADHPYQPTSEGKVET